MELLRRAAHLVAGGGSGGGGSGSHAVPPPPTQQPQHEHPRHTPEEHVHWQVAEAADSAGGAAGGLAAEQGSGQPHVFPDPTAEPFPPPGPVPHEPGGRRRRSSGADSMHSAHSPEDGHDASHGSHHQPQHQHHNHQHRHRHHQRHPHHQHQHQHQHAGAAPHSHSAYGSRRASTEDGGAAAGEWSGVASDAEVCDLLRRDVTLRNTSMLEAGFSDTSHAAHVRSLLQQEESRRQSRLDALKHLEAEASRKHLASQWTQVEVWECRERAATAIQRGYRAWLRRTGRYPLKSARHRDPSRPSTRSSSRTGPSSSRLLRTVRQATAANGPSSPSSSSVSFSGGSFTAGVSKEASAAPVPGAGGKGAQQRGAVPPLALAQPQPPAAQRLSQLAAGTARTRPTTQRTTARAVIIAGGGDAADAVAALAVAAEALAVAADSSSGEEGPRLDAGRTTLQLRPLNNPAAAASRNAHGQGQLTGRSPDPLPDAVRGGDAAAFAVATAVMSPRVHHTPRREQLGVATSAAPGPPGGSGAGAGAAAAPRSELAPGPVFGGRQVDVGSRARRDPDGAGAGGGGGVALPAAAAGAAAAPVSIYASSLYAPTSSLPAAPPAQAAGSPASAAQPHAPLGRYPPALALDELRTADNAATTAAAAAASTSPHAQLRGPNGTVRRIGSLEAGAQSPSGPRPPAAVPPLQLAQPPAAAAAAGSFSSLPPIKVPLAGAGANGNLSAALEAALNAAAGTSHQAASPTCSGRTSLNGPQGLGALPFPASGGGSFSGAAGAVGASLLGRPPSLQGTVHDAASVPGCEGDLPSSPSLRIGGDGPAQGSGHAAHHPSPPNARRGAPSLPANTMLVGSSLTAKPPPLAIALGNANAASTASSPGGGAAAPNTPGGGFGNRRSLERMSAHSWAAQQQQQQPQQQYQQSPQGSPSASGLFAAAARSGGSFLAPTPAPRMGPGPPHRGSLDLPRDGCGGVGSAPVGFVVGHSHGHSHTASGQAGAGPVGTGGGGGVACPDPDAPPPSYPSPGRLGHHRTSSNTGSQPPGVQAGAADEGEAGPSLADLDVGGVPWGSSAAAGGGAWGVGGGGSLSVSGGAGARGPSLAALSAGSWSFTRQQAHPVAGGALARGALVSTLVRGGGAAAAGGGGGGGGMSVSQLEALRVSGARTSMDAYPASSAAQLGGQQLGFGAAGSAHPGEAARHPTPPGRGGPPAQAGPPAPSRETLAFFEQGERPSALLAAAAGGGAGAGGGGAASRIGGRGSLELGLGGAVVPPAARARCTSSLELAPGDRTLTWRRLGLRDSSTGSGQHPEGGGGGGGGGGGVAGGGGSLLPAVDGHGHGPAHSHAAQGQGHVRAAW
ncbi:hypothetical protein HXX76_005000 [Chlamydomonas incerta]|uniref:Uncharacterized protein n=1 Tax=Chlamydomonas incerta TaxID=51695 RepID=A0A835TIZ1_CHLIN|nr:hypothetical protein HXX76_005000 [Chlamydomonas incerta]|eukprot:KAG2439650.1 hypothetical protein HXX76_005000 [Chlamydomonas incerta]